MVKPVNIAALEAGTQTTWPEWCALLGEADAASLDHNGIVKLARAARPITGWWAQGVAVAYEQHIGRRLPGQTSDGHFSASVSRTIAGSPDTAYRTWCTFAAGLDTIGNKSLAGSPTTSATPKRLYWRCKCTDGSSAALSIEAKTAHKVLMVVEHKKLTHHTDISDLKTTWAALLDACFGY